MHTTHLKYHLHTCIANMKVRPSTINIWVDLSQANNSSIWLYAWYRMREDWCQTDWHTFLFTSAWLSHLRSIHTSYPASLPHSSRSARTGSLHLHKPNNVREILAKAGQEGSGAKKGEKLYRSLNISGTLHIGTPITNHHWQLHFMSCQRASLGRNQPITNFPVKVRF